MKLRALAVAAALVLGGLTGVFLLSSSAYAADCPEGSLNDTYTNSLAECNIPTNAPGTDKTLMERAMVIINVVVGVVSVIAVAVIVVGAILFVTSTGEAAKTTRARNTIIYGVVGLVISLLAFAIVNFVTKAIFSGGGASSGSSSSSSSSSSSESGDD